MLHEFSAVAESKLVTFFRYPNCYEVLRNMQLPEDGLVWGGAAQERPNRASPRFFFLNRAKSSIM